MSGYYYYCPIQSGDGISSTWLPSDHGHNAGDSLDLHGDGRERWEVFAIAGGKILLVRNDEYAEDNINYKYTTGNCIVQEITDDCDLKGMVVTYMHFTPTHMIPWVQGIQEGAYVKRGDLLGYAGSTGNSTGVHLHLQIRDTHGGLWGGDTIPYKNYTPASGYRIGSATNPAGAQGYTQQLFRNIQPFYYTPPKEEELPISPDDKEVRLACTLAIVEAQVLDLIGMEEAVACLYNRRLSTAFPNSMYEIITQSNQFSTYYPNKTLFDSGGYSKAEIDNKAPGLWEFTSKLFNGQITTTNSNGWAAGYNSNISKVYYFRSDIIVSKDYLYSRYNNGYNHHYNGIHMWS